MATVSNIIGEEPIAMPNPAVTRTRLPTNMARAVSKISTSNEPI